MAVVDPFGEDDVAEQSPGVIVTHRPDHRDGRTGTGGGDRLVEPLAAGELGVVGTTHGLPGSGETIRPSNEIQVQAADHDDIEFGHGARS